MDLAPEDLQFLTVPEILKHSHLHPIPLPKNLLPPHCHLHLPSLLCNPHPLIHLPPIPFPSPPTTHPPPPPPHSSSSFFLYQFLYLLFLFSFSLLSTVAVVFTVASIYTSKPTSCSSTLHAIPSVFRRLFITFLWISLLLFSCNFFFVAAFIALILALAIVPPSLPLILLTLFALFVLFIVVYVYLTAVWHLASVISVLEPIYGLAAMKKSRELLKGSTPSAVVLVLIYLGICGGIGGVFRSVGVLGRERGIGTATRVLAGGFLVALLVLVNLVGLLVQSVFYNVCKSYHHQEIDKSVLEDHLGRYLGEYVPLKSSIQMEEISTASRTSCNAEAPLDITLVESVKSQGTEFRTLRFGGLRFNENVREQEKELVLKRCDCGIFVMALVDCLLKCRPLTVTNAGMWYCRQKIVVDIYVAMEA